MIRRLLTGRLLGRLARAKVRMQRPPHRRVRRLVRDLAQTNDPIVRARLRFAIALRLVCIRVRKRAKTERGRSSARAQRKRKFRRGMEVVYAIKNRPCLDCGLFYGAERMEFDHVPERGPKVDSILNMARGPRQLLLDELAKCDVLCCRCHEKRERVRGRTHATGVRECPNARLPGGCLEGTLS